MKFLNFEINLIVQKREREPDGRGKNSQRVWQEAENRQRKRFWQCGYAAISLYFDLSGNIFLIKMQLLNFEINFPD